MMGDVLRRLWTYTEDVDCLEGLGGLYILAYIGWILECTNGTGSLHTDSSSQNVGVPSDPVRGQYRGESLAMQLHGIMLPEIAREFKYLLSHRIPSCIFYIPSIPFAPYETRDKVIGKVLDRGVPILPNMLPKHTVV